MTARNPLNDFFEQVAALLRLAQEGKPTGEPPEDIEKRLADLEYRVELFKKVTDDTFKRAGLSEERVQETLQSLEKLSVYDRNFMERVEKLKKDVDSTQQALAIEVTIAKQREAIQGKKGKGIQTRKKKFRRLGGREDWKPL